MNIRKIGGIVCSLALLAGLFSGLSTAAATTTGDSFSTVYEPVTALSQLPKNNLLSGKIPTNAAGATINVANGTKLANLTDGGVQGLDQAVAYRLTENAKNNNGTGDYYNWIAPAELVELLGCDTAKTWYIEDANKRWWNSNVNETAGTLYKNNAKLVYDLGAQSQVEQIFIASSTEIGDGPANNNTAGPNVQCSWETVQQQMKVTHPDRYALVCHVYIGDTRNVFAEGTEIMSFDWQETADNAKALRNLFTLSAAAKGRYIGFDFSDEDAVSDFIRLSELAVYGAQVLSVTDIDADNVATVAIQPEENLLKNATMSGTATDNTGKLYDGITYLTDSSAYLWCPSGGTSRELWFQWDLGQAYNVDSFMLIGSGNNWSNVGCGVYGMDVYVGDKTAAELQAETDNITQPDYTTEDYVGCKDIKGRRIDFVTPLEGRYIVVRVGGYPVKGSSNFGQVWISELGATGTPVSQAVGYDVNTSNADKAIAAADNVLAKRVSVQWAADTAGATVKTPVLNKDLFDGKICGVNATNEYSDPIGDAETMLLTVDMGRSYQFDSFMLAGSGIGKYGVEGFSLFINDTPLTAMAGAADRQAVYTHDSNVTNGYRVDFTTPQTGQYVHILCKLKDNQGNWQAWLSELAATGTAVKQTVGYDVDKTNADKAIAAADNVLAKKVSVQWATDTAGATAGGLDLSYCFDGVMGGVNADYGADMCNAPQSTADTMLLTIDMGRSYQFDSFMLAGSGTGGYGVEGFSLFINDTPLSAMVGAANRQALYSHDSRVQNGYRVDFASPQTGRYVHILCKLRKNGNYQMWLSELAATGTAGKLEKKIITVGDSITEGIHFPNLGSWSTATFENRYSDVVTERLNQNDPEYAYVLYNAGISGAATVGVERLENANTKDTGLDWFNHTRKTDKIQYCDILTIMLGTNDAPYWNTRKALYKECYTRIVNAYREKNPNLKLYVLTSPYTPNSSYSALEQEIVPLQKQLAQELGGTVIDVYTYTKAYTLAYGEAAFIDEIDTAMGLQVHPGENGHKVIADIVYAGITGATGWWETITADSPIWQRENNRLKGLTPLRIDGTPIRVKDTQYLTDGRLNAEPERTLVDGFCDGWAPLTFDLGAEYTLDQFLVAGDYESAGYAPHRVKIYVSNTRETLYDDASLVVDSGAMEHTAKQWQLQPVGGTATGRYVSFLIYMPDGDVSSDLCFDDAGNKLYSNWHSSIRLGELGVYGSPTGRTADDPKPTKTVVCVGDSLTAGVWNDNQKLCGDKRSYPQQLAELLNTADSPYFYAVTNAGYGGNTLVSTTDENGWMELHPEEIVAADYVMIALGGNDAANWAPRRELYRAKYQALVNAFREKNPDVQVFVLTPQYMTTDHHIALEAEILALQKDIAEELGAVYIDNYTPTKRYYQQHGSSYFGDPNRGLHPGEEGLGVVARNVYRAMTSSTRVLGTQRRLSGTAEGTAALRFGMAVDCTDVTVGDGYAAVYGNNPTVTVAGKTYRLVDMGGVAAVADRLTDVETQLVQGGDGVKTVRAAKLYSAENGQVRFVVTVVDIPENAYDKAVAVRPYVEYAADDGTKIVVYGNIQYACVNDFPLK